MSERALELRDVVCMFKYIADEMILKEAYFCELDSVLGDGDHGVTISRGWSAAKEILDSPQKNLETLFQAMGNTMAASMGGAVGPIYAFLLDGFAAAVSGEDRINLHVAVSMFEEATTKIRIGAAVEEGQKTMFDALAPATLALQSAEKEGRSLLEGFEAAKMAAKIGAEATEGMMAKKGRARFLREKSVGHIDAGAGSMAVLIAAMADFLAEREET